MAELHDDHRNRIEELDPGSLGIGTEPSFAIGQRALLVDGLLWDCITLLDDDTAAAVERCRRHAHDRDLPPALLLGDGRVGRAFDARVLLHEDDGEWVMRPSERIELWAGERRRVGDELELIRLGGHFEGGTVCLWSAGADGRGALLSGDIVQVVPDRDWVSFMYSYPNLIPLPPREVERIRGVVETLAFDRVYGAWWDRIVAEDAKAKVLGRRIGIWRRSAHLSKPTAGVRRRNEQQHERRDMAGQMVHLEIPAGTPRRQASSGARSSAGNPGVPRQSVRVPHDPVLRDDRRRDLRARPADKRGARVYFDVDDINAGAARVKELGGEGGEAHARPRHGLVRDLQGHRGQRVRSLADRPERGHAEQLSRARGLKRG